MVKNVSLYEKITEYFNYHGQTLSQPELSNAIRTVYELLQDEDLVVEVMIRAIYNLGGAKNASKRTQENKKTAEESREAFIASSRLQ